MGLSFGSQKHMRQVVWVRVAAPDFELVGERGQLRLSDSSPAAASDTVARITIAPVWDELRLAAGSEGIVGNRPVRMNLPDHAQNGFLGDLARMGDTRQPRASRRSRRRGVEDASCEPALRSSVGELEPAGAARPGGVHRRPAPRRAAPGRTASRQQPREPDPRCISRPKRRDGPARGPPAGLRGSGPIAFPLAHGTWFGDDDVPGDWASRARR